MSRGKPTARTTSWMRPRRATTILFLAVSLPIAVLHLGSLTIPFIGDAYGFLMHVGGERGIDWTGVAREFTSTWGGVSDLRLYRPLSTFTATLDHMFFGLPVFGMHYQHLLLHVLNALLVSAIVRLFTPHHTIGPAIAAGLFFGLHTISTDCLCNLCTRPDMQVTFFVLASVLAFFRYARCGHHRFLVISMVVTLVGITAKEVALTVPLIAAAASAVYFLRTRERRWIVVAAAYGGLLLAMLSVRYLLFGKISAGYAPIEPWFTLRQAGLVLENLAVSMRLIFFPVDPVHVPTPVFWWVGVGTAAILAALFLQGGGRKFLRPPQVAALLLLFLPLAMIAWFWHFASLMYGFHRSYYLPLAGAALLVFLPAARLQLPRRVRVTLVTLLLVVMAAMVHRGIRSWDHEGKRIEAVAQHARAEAARTPDRWVMMAAIPEWGAWFPLAMRPPHSPRDFGKVIPLTLSGFTANPARASAIIAAGGRICLWNEAGRDFVRIPGGEAFVPTEKGTLAERIPELDRWGAAPDGCLVSPPIRVSPYELRAIEVDGGAPGEWELGWKGRDLAGALRFVCGPESSHPKSSHRESRVVVPLFTTPDYYRPLACLPSWPTTAFVTQLRLRPPAGETRRPKLRYLARLPRLEVELADDSGLIRPAEGWTVRFPSRPRNLRLYFINQGWQLVIPRAQSGPDGVLRLERGALLVLRRLVDVRGRSPVLFYAETLADPANRFSVQARTRFIELTAVP